MSDTITPSKVFVVGGFGRQGRGVVDALRAAGVAVRTLTRRSPAEITVDDGVEVLWGKEMATATVADMAGWLHGCQALFLNLDYWSLGAALEQDVGRRWIDAAAAVSLPHLVYSTLDSCSQLSDGRLPFEAFDSKRVVEDYLRERAAGVRHWTCVKFATYFENFVAGHTQLRRQCDDNGRPYVVFAYPTAGHGVTFVPCHDAGRVIAQIMLQPRRYHARCIGLASEHLTLEELAAIFEKEVGIRADVNSDDSAANNMWKVKQQHEATFRQYVADSSAIVPDLQRLDSWFRNNAHHWQH